MSPQETINSTDYWDNRFDTDWEANGGKEQSRFFARIAVEAMPSWLVHIVRWNRLSVCDWGCAQGDGTEMLVQMLSWDVTGIDFSATAVKHARERYGTIKFSHENLLEAPKRPLFDVLFSSNTLEHFLDPWGIFHDISKYASRFIVLLLPYREFERHAEHEVTFDASNIPIAPTAEWGLVYSRVVNTGREQPSYWPGQQILLVYGRTTELVDRHLTLADSAPPGIFATDDVATPNTPPHQWLAHYTAELEAAHEARRLVQSRANSLQATLEAEISRADGEMARAEVARTQHATELATARNACRVAQLEAASLQARFEAATSRADAATVQAQTLQAQHAVELKAARETCQLAQVEVSSLRTRLEAEMSRADAEAAQAKTAQARYESELAGAREAYRLLQSEMTTLHTRLAAEIARADAQAAQAEAAQAQHAAELTTARQACLLAESEVTSLGARLAAEIARANAEAAQTEAMRSLHADQLATAQEQCRHAQSEAMAVHTRLEAAESAMAKLSAELAQEQLEANRLAEEHETLRLAASKTDEHVRFLQYREQSLIHEIDTLLATKSWRMTAPLRVVRAFPRWARRRMDDIHYAYVQGGVRNVALRSLTYVPKRLARRPAALSAPTTYIEAQVDVAVGQLKATESSESGFRLPMADVFVFSVIDWHFRIQRPQHLAREFARSGHRVYFFSNHFEDSAEPGFSIERLDEALPLYQIKLKVRGAPAIYFAPPTPDAVRQILDSLNLFRSWSGAIRTWSIVQHAYWYPVAMGLQSQCLSYDCMDHHEGFGNVPRELLELEETMMRRADLLVATSSWLDDHARRYNRHVAVIRNAGQYADFCDTPAERFIDPRGRRIIGYYGAIAEWFDVELVTRIAQAFPDALVLLVGNDSADVGARMKAFSNVQMTGEVPYAQLPYYLYAFDVCLLPFKVMPLTLATNPVKVYEYLSAGRPVVAVDLPEMAQFGGLVKVAGSVDGFIVALSETLAELPEHDERIARRKSFASGQTWAHRVRDFRHAIEALPRPRVSAVVLTYNNLALTKDCLDSLDAHREDVDLEIVIVDNASSDGSPAYLSSWASSRSYVKLILNHENRGFAAGNNQGLAEATGDYLVLLNNDTVVTSGWARRMVNHLRNRPDIGILGPLTNNIGNEARIQTRYTNLSEMHREARQITDRNLGAWFELDTVAFFCAMLPRSTYERCGPLSEDYGVGFFEDDDYCRRVQAAGLTVACAEDVFVHHHLSASFDKLGAERKLALFETNRAVYEAKWGPWRPHKYRASANESR